MILEYQGEIDICKIWRYVTGPFVWSYGRPNVPYSLIFPARSLCAVSPCISQPHTSIPNDSLEIWQHSFVGGVVWLLLSAVYSWSGDKSLRNQLLKKSWNHMYRICDLCNPLPFVYVYSFCCCVFVFLLNNQIKWLYIYRFSRWLDTKLSTLTKCTKDWSDWRKNSGKTYCIHVHIEK